MILKNDPRAGCKQFAPEEYWQSSPEDVDAVTGGCGPGEFGDYLVPDRLLGLSIWACCRIHDFCYHIEYPKLMSDAFFLVNMILKIHYESSTLMKWPRMLMANKYFLAVYFAGGKAYKS